MSPATRAVLRRTLVRLCSLTARKEAGLRILTYHRVNDRHPHDRLTVTPQAFAEQMEALREAGRPVLPLARVLPGLTGGEPVPAGAVALTFDDGYADNATDALPILERFGFPAAFFVVTGLMGTSRTLDRYQTCCDADRMMGWDEVRALRDRGHTIGGHGRTHCELAGLPDATVREEVEQCAEDIRRETGERPTLFCYPRGSEDAQARRMVGEAGYVAACSVYPGANPPGGELLALRRTEVSGDDTLADFRLKLEGGFDAWHRLAQARHRRARW